MCSTKSAKPQSTPEDQINALPLVILDMLLPQFTPQDQLNALPLIILDMWPLVLRKDDLRTIVSPSGYLQRASDARISNSSTKV